MPKWRALRPEATKREGVKVGNAESCVLAQGEQKKRAK